MENLIDKMVKLQEDELDYSDPHNSLYCYLRVSTQTQVDEGSFILTGRVPLATSMDYVVQLSSLSSGRASLSAQFDGYDPCPSELGQVRPYRGISPLDRAKYILWWRGAITDSHR